MSRKEEESGKSADNKIASEFQFSLKNTKLPWNGCHNTTTGLKL